MALHKISVGTVKKRKLRITQARFCLSYNGLPACNIAGKVARRRSCLDKFTGLIILANLRTR